MINGGKYIVSGWSKLKTRNLYLFQNNQRHSLLRLANLMPTRQLEHLLAIESIWNTYILEERERESRCFLMNFHALGQEEKSMCLPMCQKSIIESMEWHHFLTEESFGLQHSYLVFPKKGPRTNENVHWQYHPIALFRFISPWNTFGSQVGHKTLCAPRNFNNVPLLISGISMNRYQGGKDVKRRSSKAWAF